MAGILQYGELTFNMQDAWAMRFNPETLQYEGPVAHVARPQMVEVSQANDLDNLMTGGQRLHSLSVKTGVEVGLKMAGMDYDACVVMVGGILRDVGNPGERVRRYRKAPLEDFPYFGMICTGSTEGGPLMAWVAPAIKLMASDALTLDGEANAYSMATATGESISVDILRAGAIQTDRFVNYEGGPTAFTPPANDAEFRAFFGTLAVNPDIPPATPQNIDSYVRTTSIRIVFDAVPGATSYEASYSTGGGAATVVTGWPHQDQDRIAFIISGLAASTDYDITLAALNAAGTGVASAEITVSTAASNTGGPDSPTSLSADYANGILTLSWTAPASPGTSALVGYIVSTRVQGASNEYARTFIPAPATSHEVVGLLPGVNYSSQLAAVNATLSSGNTSQVNEAITAIGAPEAVAGNAVAAVRWPAPVELPLEDDVWNVAGRGFRVLNSGGQPAAVLLGQENSAALVVTPSATILHEGETTDLTLTATSATPSLNAADDPGRPTAITVTRGVRALTIGWTAPSDPGGTALEGYIVALAVRGSDRGYAFAFVTGVTITVNDLIEGAAYNFRIAAVNDTRIGPFSPTEIGAPV